MNIKNFHATGNAKNALVTRVIDDEKDGRRRQFAFAATETGDVFIHLGVVADFALESGSSVWLQSGDYIDLDYEVNENGGRLQRRATKLLAHREGDVCEGVVTVHPKGFGFIKADTKHGLDKSVFVANALVETAKLADGERVQFSHRQSARGFQAVWVASDNGDVRRPALQYDGNASTMQFGGDNSRKNPSVEAKARKAERAEEDRRRRLQMRGSGGSEAKVTSNPKKIKKRERKLAQRKG